jgi:hypothetical protein
MAVARLFTKPRPPIVRRPHELAADRVFEAGFRWGKWSGVVFLSSVLALALGYGVWWAWLAWQDSDSEGAMLVAQMMGMAAFFCAALAWAVAVFGLRAQHRGHVLRADAAGVSVAGLGRVIPWSNILSVEEDRDFMGLERTALWIRLLANAADNPAHSNSWRTWLWGRAPCVEVSRDLVLVRTSYGRTTPRAAAEGICRAGALHGWKPTPLVRPRSVLSEFHA